MFSTTQLDMLEPLVQAYYEEGYNYYLVHTNTSLENAYTSYNFYDLTFYFSKEPINYENNKFQFTGDYIIINAITRNVSNNTSDNKVDRIVKSTGTSSTISVNLYEHIMTNAENSIFMNTLAIQEYDVSNNLSYNIDVNDFVIPSILLCAILIFMWLRTWFGKTYRGD